MAICARPYNPPIQQTAGFARLSTERQDVSHTVEMSRSTKVGLLLSSFLLTVVAEAEESSVQLKTQSDSFQHPSEIVLTLHNRDSQEIFLSPLHPPASAWLERADPGGSWEKIESPAICANGEDWDHAIPVPPASSREVPLLWRFAADLRREVIKLTGSDPGDPFVGKFRACMSYATSKWTARKLDSPSRTLCSNSFELGKAEDG